MMRPDVGGRSSNEPGGSELSRVAVRLIAAAVVASVSIVGTTSARQISVAGAQRAPRDVSNLAHRGASGLAPENTYAAWDLAWTQGADYIEQDVRMTSDGVLVVLHDATLDRTARGPAENCTGAVSEKTLGQLMSCDVGSWFNEAYPNHARPEYVGLRIPTVDGVFRRYGRDANYYIEIKQNEPRVEQELIRLLNEFELRRPAVRVRRVVIQSFAEAALRRIHQSNPRLPLSQLFGQIGPDGVRSELVETSSYAVVIGPQHTDVTRGLIRDAHALGLEVHPYTVDEPARMTALIDLGVDGIFTNFPRRLRRIAP